MHIPDNKRKKGFSLVELVVAIMVIGVLGTVLTPYITGTVEKSKATAIDRATADANQAWKLINQSCNTDSTVAGSPIPDSTASRTVADVIFGGATYVAAAYKSCYNQANVTALADAAQPGTTAGTWMVKGYVVTPGGGGSNPFTFSVAAVPDSVTLPLARIYNPNISDPLPNSDSTSNVVQFTALASGTRTVTVLKR